MKPYLLPMGALLAAYGHLLGQALLQLDGAGVAFELQEATLLLLALLHPSVGADLEQ
jgi:hypothetical protein